MAPENVTMVLRENVVVAICYQISTSHIAVTAALYGGKAVSIC